MNSGQTQNRPPPPGRLTLAEAAQQALIRPESLRAWTESGHAPHYFVEGEGPFYKITELREWVKENLVRHCPGMPIPRKLDVLRPVESVRGGAPPLSIASLRTLCHVPLTATCPGIYFLCSGPEVVYVGQSVQVLARLGQHLNEGKKDFDLDRVFFLPCPREELTTVEEHFIRLLRPRYNGGQNGLSSRRVPQGAMSA